MLDELDRKLAAGQVDLASELAEAEAALRRRASSRSGTRRRRRSARRTGTARRRRRTLEVDVERERARFGAWYELFPRSWGGFKGVEKVLPAARRARLRRPLPAADPPDRDDEPEGAQQRARLPTKGDPGSPWAIGGPGGRPRRDPSRARHGEGLRPARRGGRASTASRSRSTSRSSARPTTRGSSSIRSGSTGGRTGRSSTRRTHPSATRTSTTSTSTRRTGAGSGRLCATSFCTGAGAASAPTASTTRTRSRSRSGSG